MTEPMDLPLDENGNPIYPKVHLPRPPANEEELWWVVRQLWGVEIPRVRVCPDHVAPFDAFAEGYFGNESNWALWYGSRGTGKSLMLALLALTKAAILEINVALLGGSMAQSQNVQEHIENLLLYPAAPRYAIAQQIQTQITFSGGNWIRPLPASQKTVRGPHPQMTCFVGETPVVMRTDGEWAYMREMDCLKVGDTVLGWDGSEIVDATVLRVMKQGYKSTNIYTFKGQGVTRSVQCTADHRFMTVNGWVEAQHLTASDEVLGLLSTYLTIEPETYALIDTQPGATRLVYDITTTTGNFYANELLVHNCLDEIDEMERKVYDAAMGQAMAKPNARGIVIPEMVIASSTWQNPVGTFQSVRDEALSKGLPVRTWCWREVLKTDTNPTGWMDPAFIERKRASVPAEMFRVEYDMGEPAGGSRAFDLEKLNKAFTRMDPVEERHAGNDDLWVFEEPALDGWYAVGADWAKEKDKTVIVVARIDRKPHRVVYLRRVNRRPWPEMAEMFNDVLNRYQAVAAHDGTGIGNVVNDMIDERARKVVMVGRARTELLVEYISAVERGEYLMPANTPAFDAHKSTTVEEVYAPGKWNSHLADDVAAFALMHDAASKQAPPAAAQGVRKGPMRFTKTPDVEPEFQPGIVSGEVSRRDDEGGNPYLVF